MNFLEELQSLDFNDIGRWPSLFRSLFVTLFFAVAVGAGFYFLVFEKQMPRLEREDNQTYLFTRFAHTDTDLVLTTSPLLIIFHPDCLIPNRHFYPQVHRYNSH